jgi:putative endonuclease
LVEATGDRRRGTARRGEAIAALFLRLKGYRIEARNWRCPLGEIDIVAWDRDTLVFVEVKARTGTSAGAPEEAVNARKQARLIQLAQAYLSRRRGEMPPCRFDVIAVERRRPLPRIRHLRAAFRADGMA